MWQYIHFRINSRKTATMVWTYKENARKLTATENYGNQREHEEGKDPKRDG
jgi:hypothetical protein